MAVASATPSNITWEAQDGPQSLMLQCPYEELLYGGAAGGGKTDALLGDYSSGIDKYGGAWRGIIFRRSYPQLEEIELRALEIWGPIYGAKCYNKSNHQWNFPNGATLKLRHLDNDAAVLNYQGHQYCWIAWDELTQWPSDYAYFYMMGSRLRSPHGVPCRVRATTNPGGPGHGWVKARFIDPAPPYTVIQEEMNVDGETKTFRRVFIPARVDDNKILMRNDPLYLSRLDMIPDEGLRKALRDGRWDIFSGQAFGEWDPRIHVCPPHNIPPGAIIWRGMDWGYSKPYCCLWFYSDMDGELYIINELYGWGGKPNKGSKEAPDVVGARIKAIEDQMGWWVATGWLDSACWYNQGQRGPTIYDSLGGAQLGWKPTPKGPTSRVQGKMRVHELLKTVNGKSRLHIFSTCRHLIRTLPALPLATSNVEDVDTDAEDHAYDAFRYGVLRNVLSKQQRQSRRVRNALREQVLSGRSTTEFGSW